MSRLVFDCAVHPIGSTTLDPSMIKAWAEHHGYGHLLEQEGTPLQDIYQAIQDPRTHLDRIPEFAGRFCYRSWEVGRNHNAYIENIIEQAHGSVLAHSDVLFAISGVSRSLSHELVRHGVGTAISQESQRYVDAKDVRFVVPILMIEAIKANDEARRSLEESFEGDVERYGHAQVQLEEQARIYGWDGHSLKKRVNEAAREFLPNAAETRAVWKGNLRALRHICELRGNPAADLQIMRFAERLTTVLKVIAPSVFDDFDFEPSDYPGVIPSAVFSKHRKV